MFIRVIFVIVCTLFCTSTAVACMSSFRLLKSKSCEVVHNQAETAISWSEFVARSKESCKLSDEEVSWLQENAPSGSHIFEQTDEEYKSYAESLEKAKTQKTPRNATKLTTIDKKNECGATTILKRHGRWTVSRKDRGSWSDGRCLRPKC